MSQSRRHSIFESIINVIVGFSINMALNFTVFPLFGWRISLEQNVVLGLIFTVISIIRSYTLRRLFNRWHMAQRDAIG